VTVEAESLLTPSEAAAVLGIPPGEVGRLADRGQLSPLYTLGRHRRYREAEVRDLARRREEQGELLTASEVAGVFKVHRNSVHRWVRLGLLVPAGTGSRGRLYRKADVEALSGVQAPGPVTEPTGA